MSYLFAVSLGPVEGFIAAARKIRDLYAGSWILSEVAKATSLMLAGQELIFPAASRAELQSPDFTAVNKILAVVETQSPSELARDLKDAAMGKLREMAARVRTPRSLQYEQVRMMEHLEATLEFNAAWIRFDDSMDYSEQRAKLEQLMYARKTLHSFAAHHGIPGRRKCSLDGGRETIILSRSAGAAEQIRLRRNEELDGPGLLKRFLDIRVRFESTSEAAALPYVRKLEREAIDNLELADALGAMRRMNEDAGLRWDSGELLYEHESREVFENDSARAQGADRIRKQLYDLAGRPDAPYYALLIADGDSMGECLSGLTKDQHQELSRSLSEFAASVRGLLFDSDCMPIFAGGDDILAVIPLHRLREAAWGIRSMFGQVSAGGRTLTLSAGIAVAHALEPLDEVRSAAKQAERAAKNVEGKDAVSIVVRPRSGASVQATGKWDSMGDGLGQIVQALRAGRLSYGFAHELQGLLNGTYPELDEVLPSLASAMARKKEAGASAAVNLVGKAIDREALEALKNQMLVLPFTRNI